MPPHGPMASVLAVALLLPALPAAVGTPIDGLPEGIGIRLQDVPVDRADDPRANNYIVDHAIPGGTVRRTLLVTNGTDDPLPVQMKGVSASATDGWIVDEAQGTPAPDSLAAWVVVEPAAFTLAPQSGLEVEVTITVPADVPAGERYAAVVAEPPTVDAGAGIGVVSRVGIRVYLSVGGDEPVTDFEIDTLTASRSPDGIPLVDVGVRNTGGRAVDVGGELSLESEDGLLSAGPFPTSIPSTLGPGTRGEVAVALPADLGAGPWVVTATMRSGLVERRARATVTFPDGTGDVADPVEVERLEAQRRALLPVATALLLLAIASLWLLLVWRRNDREAAEEAETPAASVARPDGG